MKSIRNFFWMGGAMVLLLTGSELLKGNPLDEALVFALGWGLLSAGIFAASSYYRARKGIRCALCHDEQA